MKHHKQPSQRQLRVGEEVRHALASLLQRGELRDLLSGNSIIAVSEVRMSPDLKLATCFISVTEITKPSEAKATAHIGNKDAVIDTLNHRAKYIRGHITPALKSLRYMPEFRFHRDSSFDNFSKIDSLLRSPEVARDLQDSAIDSADSDSNTDN